MGSKKTDMVAKLLNEDGLACLLNGEDAEATQSFIEDFCAGKTLGIWMTVNIIAITHNELLISKSEPPACIEELCCEEETCTEEEAYTEEDPQSSGKNWNIPDTYCGISNFLYA